MTKVSVNERMNTIVYCNAPIAMCAVNWQTSSVYCAEPAIIMIKFL